MFQSVQSLMWFEFRVESGTERVMLTGHDTLTEQSPLLWLVWSSCWTISTLLKASPPVCVCVCFQPSTPAVWGTVAVSISASNRRRVVSSAAVDSVTDSTRTANTADVSHWCWTFPWALQISDPEDTFTTLLQLLLTVRFKPKWYANTDWIFYNQMRHENVPFCV